MPKLDDIAPQWFNVWQSETNERFRNLSVVGLDPQSVYLGQVLTARGEAWRIIKLDLVAGRIDLSLQRVESQAPASQTSVLPDEEEGAAK